MIIALEIATALSLVALIAVYASSLPKPRRVRIPVKDVRVGEAGQTRR